MIDEHHEEAAALYALDLLEGAERSAFEASLARDPALRQLVDQLRESAAGLATTAPATAPSAALRSRILASVAALPAQSTPPARASNIVPVNVSSWLGWAAAACFALGTAYFAQRYTNTRAEVLVQRDAAEVSRLEAQGARQQLEAERIITARQLADLRSSSETSGQENQLARIEIKTLRARLEAELLSSSRQLAELRKSGDIANLKIARLADLLGNSPQAVAIAVWNPLSQEGVLTVEKLPVLQRDQDYQLWVVDPLYTNPVNGGVFTVDDKGVARIQFHPDQPISGATHFAISRERKGGVPKAEGPIVAAGAL